MVSQASQSSRRPLFRLRITTLFKWNALNSALECFPPGERKYVRRQLWHFIQVLVDAGVSADVVIRLALPHLVAEFNGSSRELVDQISDVIGDVGAGHAESSAWLSQTFVALARELWTHTDHGSGLSRVAGETLIRSGDRTPITSTQALLEDCERLDREYDTIVSYMGSDTEDDYLALASMNMGYPPSGSVDHWRSMAAAHDLVETYRARVESWRAFEQQFNNSV
jgi:hypothetical protein